MFTNTQKSVWSRLQVELGQRKDIIAYAGDRDSAQAIAQDVRNEIETFDHIDTGRMLNSVTATTRGGEHVVTAVDYAKYVNGYDRESDGAGFIDDAVNNAILDGYDGEVAV
jgi:hypothetical protein